MGRKPISSTRTASFCKVMFGDFTQHLKIPPAFVKHFDGGFPQQFVLRSRSRRVRHVNVEKVNQQSYFGTGWSLFVKDNSLEFGDFLVFHYNGNTGVNVTIFGKNGCKKEDVETERNDVIYVEDDYTGTGNEMSSPQDQFRTSEFHSLQGNSKELAHKEMRRENIAMEMKARAFEAAEDFISKNPFFKVFISECYLHKSNVSVPITFIRAHVKAASQSVTLQVSKRSWVVKLLIYKNYGKLSDGWRPFVKDNTLQAGDVCIFELIRKKDIVLKVHILRRMG